MMMSNVSDSYNYGMNNYSYGTSPIGNPQNENAMGPNGKKVEDNPDGECQTCKNRKYVDGSDEMVSYKAPTKISPGRAATAVRAHEQEHVANAYSKAERNNGKVVSATVSIRMDICPECGRSYVAGGTTSTQIKYRNEENPYQQDLKATDKIKYAGMNADYAV